MAGHRQDQQALPLLAEQKLGPSQICKVIIILQQGMRENKRNAIPILLYSFLKLDPKTQMQSATTDTFK